MNKHPLIAKILVSISMIGHLAVAELACDVLAPLDCRAENSALVEPERVAENFLNRFSEISVAFTYAPGNGHFAATKATMNRMRELGFRGKFKIYIDPRIRKFVSNVLPELSKLNAETHELIMKRRGDEQGMYTVGDLKPKPREFKTFGIIGGDDTYLVPKDLGVDALLVVEPPGFHRKPELRVHHPEVDDAYLAYSYPSEQNTPIHTREPEINDVQAFVKNQMEAADFASKSAGMQELVKHLGEHEVMGAYGLGLNNGPVKLAVSLYADQALRKDASVVLKPGTVVPLFSAFSPEEWARFMEMRDESMQTKLRIVSVEDASLKSSIENLARDEILVVKVGAVPQPIWNYVMERSTYPGMVSGENGSYFLSEKGRPFINTMGRKSATNEASGKIVENIAIRLNSGDVDGVTAFYKDARDSNSETFKAFESEGTLLQNSGDRVTHLLNHVSAATCELAMWRQIIPIPPAQQASAVENLITALQ